MPSIVHIPSSYIIETWHVEDGYGEPFENDDSEKWIDSVVAEENINTIAESIKKIERIVFGDDNEPWTIKTASQTDDGITTIVAINEDAIEHVYVVRFD